MALKFASVVAVASAGSVTLQWDDCGDADTHTVITDISPVDLALPGSTTIKGTGLVDQDTNAGQFKFDAKLAGVSVLKDGGSLCEDKHIVMPLNSGTIDFHGVNCPIAAGEISVVLDINLLEQSTASNDLVTIDLSALSDTGDKLLCAALSVVTPYQATPDCSTATCPKNCQCGVDNCADETAACLAAPNCASSQTCAFSCACGDDKCLLACAAQSPSVKALPLAKCIMSKCNGLEATATPDCSTATCPKNCQCGVDNCADETAACLAAPNCASSQTCAFSCACGDDKCLLACAAQSPSVKALPLAKCIMSKCNGLEAKAAPDCSTATCPKNCQCGVDNCADETAACLAAPNCASSQTCAFSCACGDDKCLLACAAQSPSVKALPLAKCIMSKCSGSSIEV